MDNNQLKKHIAETGYNVGYTAKLHFASFEMIEKIPGIISFISMAFGVYTLAFSELSTKFMSSTLLVLGLTGIYISMKNGDKNSYEVKGRILTGLFNELKHLMTDAKTHPEETESISAQLKDIENKYNENCASNHIMFASWLGHYKFFWEQQIEWIAEYRPFGFWRDKVPLTLWVTVFTLLIIILVNSPVLTRPICNLVNLIIN
tara:strand:- start:10308 stop:10919 length:612 start_codon:yes stop_codon:yes gene_type:complete